MGSRVARRCVVVLSWFATALAEQNVTVPAMLAGVEGGGTSNIPFGSNLACRYQCLYDAEELPWTGPRVITGILVRADNNAPYAAMAAKGFLDVSVLMSTTDRTAATASAVFEENRGPDATWVIQHLVVQLPAQPLQNGGPRPANVAFAFNVPWAYGLMPTTSSLPAPRNLLVEFHVWSQPNGAYRIDSLGNCVAPNGTFGTAPGPACQFGSAPVSLTGDNSMLAGYPYSWHIANAPPSMPFLVTVNLTHTGGLLGNPAWPLPYPMFDPSNPSQPSAALALLQWSAPDCWLNLDPVMALGGVADSAGLGTVTSMLPPGRQVVGVPWHAQAIVMAPTVNALRMITSEGFTATVCGPLQVARIHAFYNGATTPPPTPPASGTVQVGVGMVFDVM